MEYDGESPIAKGDLANEVGEYSSLPTHLPEPTVCKTGFNGLGSNLF